MSITASPKEIPVIDTLIIGLEKEAPDLILIRLLIKYSKFNDIEFWQS